MSVPRPWPRRRPIAFVVVGVVALLNCVLALLKILQDGSSMLRWAMVVLWSVMVLICVVGWRRQVRLFDQETEELERTGAASHQPQPGPPAS